MSYDYQFVLTLDPAYQDVVSHQYSRLSIISNLRPSKRLLIEAGVLALRNVDGDTAARYLNRLIVENKKTSENYPPKHRSVQIFAKFADIARAIGARLSYDYNISAPTRHILHMGVYALETATDEEFNILLQTVDELTKAEQLPRFSSIVAPTS